MNIKLTGRIFLLLFLLAFNNSTNAQLWSKSFTAGNYDSMGKFFGGSEVLQLIGHKDMLFASVGYWQDGNDTSKLSPSIYIVRIENQLFKFIKI